MSWENSLDMQLPVEPMLAKTVDRLPRPSTAGSLLFEPKYDGWRALGVIDGNGGVALYSRRGTRIDAAFPEILGALFPLPRNTVLDGEIVRWVEARLDFEAVQRRWQQRRRARELAETEPAHLITFDVLQARGQPLMGKPLTARRASLQRLFLDVPATSPLALGMQTDDYDTAVGWLRDLPAVGIEGVVAKPASSRYLPGQRGWQKVKAFATTDAIVGGVTGTLARPVDLVLGRYDSQTGELRIVGRTTDLDDQLAEQLASQLEPAGAEHPWPELLPPSWTGREPAAYIRVEPTTVVEIRADPAISGGRWRHRMRVRRVSEATPADVPLDLDLE